MAKRTIAAIAAAQIILATQPVAAAELVNEDAAGPKRHAAFVGARLRIPTGGIEAGKTRTGLVVTAVEHGRSVSGRTGTRFAEGMELSLSGSGSAALRIGGTPLSKQLRAAEEESDGTRVVKTVAKVALVGAAVLGLLVLALVIKCDNNACQE